MTGDLDPKLRARLDRLAGAVPVPPERPRGLVVSTGARWRGGSANAGPGALVAIALALVLVFGAAYIAGGSRTVESGVSDSTTDGMFELSIRSPRDRYAADEPIEVVATLEYVGDEPSIEVYSHPGMPGFGVEQLDGDHGARGGPAFRMSCRPYPFRRGEPVTFPFAKSGGLVPRAPDFEFMKPLPQHHRRPTGSRATPTDRHLANLRHRRFHAG